MPDSPHNQHQVVQLLQWGAISEHRISPADTMYASTGRRLYVLGDIDGRFRPRSNPYDLHAYGKPHPNDPLAGKLQGVWAQPVKGFDSYAYSLVINGEGWDLRSAARFRQSYSTVEFEYESPLPAVPLRVTRRDFAALDLPVLFSSLTVENTGRRPLDVQVVFSAQFDLQDAWFTSLAARRNTGQVVTVENGCLAARAEVLPDQWAAAAGCLEPLASIDLLDERSGTIRAGFTLAAGEQVTRTFVMAVAAAGGLAAALALVKQAPAQFSVLLEEKQALYRKLSERGPSLVSPDPGFNRAFDLAQANLQFLEAGQPDLGRYFYAGLEIFPFWFSNDGAYSLPGLMAAGLRESSLNHLRIGLAYLGQGRVPHQISPSGKVAFAGNAQETPLWVMSVWDAYRWTGRRDFLAAFFPEAWDAMFNYVLGTIDPDGDGYPSGAGGVEVEGMGAETLDSAVYTWAALNALADMAEALALTDKAHHARARAEEIAARFDADWWDEPGGTYAMSLDDPGNARRPHPHWAVIAPLEVGLAGEQHAARTFASIRAEYLNRWGLKHTVGSDERVWTLPTATLSRAAYNYHQPELGYEMLRRIAETLDYGPIGLFHELIPEGACIVQLWSAATFLRGIIEDLLGIQVRADLHQVSLRPQIPPEWEAVGLENLVFGDHRVSLHYQRNAVRIDHHAGPSALVVRMQDQTLRIEAGGNGSIDGFG